MSFHSMGGNPTVKYEMVNDNTAFSHHLFQVTQAQGISQIPADTLSDDIDGIMQAFKDFSDQKHGELHSEFSP